MIDFETAQKTFLDYVKKYELQDARIDLRLIHTQHVVQNSEKIARSLQLSEEQINLAKLIALLHDIGRFEQAKQFHNAVDYQTMDHAAYGVYILFEQGLIRTYVKENTYDEVIKIAIRNHNQLEIEPGLTGETLLQTQLIRDADKLDSFRNKVVSDTETICNATIEQLAREPITDEIYQTFMQEKTIKTTDRKTHMDMWVSYIAFIFDFHFSICYQELHKKAYIRQMIDRIDYQLEDTKQKMENIRKKAEKYMEERGR
ncbi:MAG: HD domain-containing protein [Clostridia bacterium]